MALSFTHSAMLIALRGFGLNVWLSSKMEPPKKETPLPRIPPSGEILAPVYEDEKHTYNFSDIREPKQITQPEKLHKKQRGGVYF